MRIMGLNRRTFIQATALAFAASALRKGHALAAGKPIRVGLSRRKPVRWRSSVGRMAFFFNASNRHCSKARTAARSKSFSRTVNQSPAALQSCISMPRRRWDISSCCQFSPGRSPRT